jgi:hypothetical protein
VRARSTGAASGESGPTTTVAVPVAGSTRTMLYADGPVCTVL